jgi:thiol:disulfide interchange protein DsbC
MRRSVLAASAWGLGFFRVARVSRLAFSLLIVLSVGVFAPQIQAQTLTQTQTTPPAAPAADPTPAIRAAVETWLQGRYKVDGLRRTPVAGLWEVQIGNDLIYVDDKAQHALVEGQLVELRSNRNLTQERIEALSAVDFKDLPLNIALRQVIGKGTRKVAVFEDANCGHCRNLRRELLNLTDVTIYTFTVPILASDSELKARQAWCAPDKVKAWNELMLNGKVPDNKGACENPVAKVSELARKLRVSATPTLIFANGKRQTGGVPAPRLKQLIDENGREG